MLILLSLNSSLREPTLVSIMACFTRCEQRVVNTQRVGRVPILFRVCFAVD
jgi:hypothetical protein